MTNPRDNELLNTDDFDQQLDEMAGYRSSNDAGLGTIESSEIEINGNFNPTDLYQGETDEQSDLEIPVESLDLLTSPNLRDGETNDVMEAVEEGLTYVPPLDPAVSSADDSAEGVEVASGFGLDASETDDDNEFSLLEAVQHRLRRDSATIDLSHTIRVRELRPGTIELHGPIRDLTDEELLIGVVESVEGVEEIINELWVQ